MCRPIIEFSQVIYIIDPDFHLVLAGYQPAWVMWYIALIPQALVLCLIYKHKPEGRTQACGINITYILLITTIYHTIGRKSVLQLKDHCRKEYTKDFDAGFVHQLAS